MGIPELAREAIVSYDDVWERRDVIGVHAQRQEGMSWVGVCVPAGRLQTQDFYDLAEVADRCGALEHEVACQPSSH